MSVTKVSSAMQEHTDVRGTIGGLTLTNDGTDADHDIGIAVGFARDYTDTATMSLTGALIKRIDATWAVGTNAGGLDSTDTVAANTGYGVYLIRRSDTGVVDVLMSSDMTSAGSALTMPTNYDQKRLIGWVLTDGSSNILTFTQVGDYFKLTSALPVFVTDTTVTSVTYETATLPMPPSCEAGLIIDCHNATSGGADTIALLRTTGSSQGTTKADAVMAWSVGVTASDYVSATNFVLANANSTGGQVDYGMYLSGGTETLTLKGLGVRLLTRSHP